MRSVPGAALKDTDDIARTAAVRVLMLAPQRPLVAAALTHHLDEHRASGNRDVVLECLEVLVSPARAKDLAVVVGMLTDPHTRPDLTLLCGVVVGNATELNTARLAHRHERHHGRAAVVTKTQSPPRVGTGPGRRHGRS